MAVLQEGATPARMRRLNEFVGVDRRTVARWRIFWRLVMAGSFWQAARAAFMPPIDEARLPAGMLERFAGSAAERMIALLRFLSPITGGQVQAL